ncbi:hypothetical protein PGT21_014516 [Puccinia graminis f. sp. tritici]|uniref:Uncharacterized protein n=1 Tax=Puccinia graminis f. sp. tritici TaxID=56615 RepID=A0A5B0QIB3_PUCGR|nr:hypothetical protein PGT21_014516 [Puccinia graminis f. sp. tritici]
MKWLRDLHSKNEIAVKLIPSETMVADALTKPSITQKISDLQSSYNTARNWKRNTGAGILESNAVNGVKTVDDQVHFLCQYWDFLDPVMGSRSVAEPLYTRSSIPAPEEQMNDLSSGSSPRRIQTFQAVVEMLLSQKMKMTR